MSRPKSLDAILDGFEPETPAARETVKSGAPVTIWLSAEYKEKYDRIQERSRKRFCKKVRELIQAAIDRCDPEAAKAS